MMISTWKVAHSDRIYRLQWENIRFGQSLSHGRSTWCMKDGTISKQKKVNDIMRLQVTDCEMHCQPSDDECQMRLIPIHERSILVRMHAVNLPYVLHMKPAHNSPVRRWMAAAYWDNIQVTKKLCWADAWSGCWLSISPSCQARAVAALWPLHCSKGIVTNNVLALCQPYACFLDVGCWSELSMM